MLLLPALLYVTLTTMYFPGVLTLAARMRFAWTVSERHMRQRFVAQTPSGRLWTAGVCQRRVSYAARCPMPFLASQAPALLFLRGQLAGRWRACLLHIQRRRQTLPLWLRFYPTRFWRGMRHTISSNAAQHLLAVTRGGTVWMLAGGLCGGRGTTGVLLACLRA